MSWFPRINDLGVSIFFNFWFRNSKDLSDWSWTKSPRRKVWSKTWSELDIWSTRFANSYSTAFAQNRAKAEQLQSFNFLTAQPELAGLSLEEANKMKEQYPGKGTVDLSMFTTVSPEEIQIQQFEKEYENVIEARRTGAEIRKMQQDMLTYMFGG